jgi:hypothetical protein
MNYYLPEYRPLVVEAMRASIEDDKPLDFEAQLCTAKGNVKWCRAIGRIVRKGGKIIEVYGTFQDITERKRADVKLQETLNSLRKAVGTTIQVMVSAIEMRDPYTLYSRSSDQNSGSCQGYCHGDGVTQR